MRFLCDEMLAGLGRWLRAAGYDTAIARGGMPDEAVLRLALVEERLLLTRDRALSARCREEGVLLLSGGSLVEWGRALAARGVDWNHRPFSLCLLCNLTLLEADPLTPGIPSRRQGEAVLRCPGCGRLYWEGSHVSRMRRQLALLASAPAGTPPAPE